MQLGMVGLGRMGSNMVRRLMRDGHACVVYDLDPAAVKELAGEGARGSASLGELVGALTPPRAVWLMVPAGGATEKTIAALGERLESGDIVIDGGNSHYQDDVRHAETLAKGGIHYVDCGTSGGIWGLERGYCLMLGGERAIVEHLDPIFASLAPGRGDIARTTGRAETERPAGGSRSTAEQGYYHCGPAGAGHFVKMVHNGIEYGLMQAYAEGFDLLRNAGHPDAEERFRYPDLDLGEIAEVWRRGSVIGSWLLDLTAAALFRDRHLERYTGYVEDSGEGRWTVMAAVERAVPADVLSAALYTRFRSRQDHTFAEKVLSAMRHEFGGHAEQGGDG